MTLNETILQPSAIQQGLFQVAFRGIKATGDMALWRQPNSDYATVVLLSMYGSESQLRGIFSTLATNNEVVVGDDDDRQVLGKGWEGHLRFKAWKMGYGKYHALVWNEDLASECITVVGQTSEVEAWESFLRKKKVPFLTEWIPRIVSILVRDGLVEVLHGMNLKGWLWTTSDDTVCDRIVEEIYK
jgi:hypothetical protein